MSDLHVDFLGRRLAGPVIAASGTFGFGEEYAGIEDLSLLGGICGKGLTLHGQPGNRGERLWETPSGLINSIGLQNPGVQHFIERELPVMCTLAYGVHCADAAHVVGEVRKVCTVPLVVKLSPQAEDIPAMCQAVEAAGADAISLVNTFQACAVDIERRRPVFDNVFAGLSGPAVRPIALRMVWQAVGAVHIPVVGLGGITTGRDALEFIMAGATAVQVGTANFLDPGACVRITAEIARWMDERGVQTLDEIRGCARG